MSKKKKKLGGLGKPFVKGDPRICEKGVGLKPSEIQKKKRFGWTLVKKALGNESLTSVTDLPGVAGEDGGYFLRKCFSASYYEWTILPRLNLSTKDFPKK